jgi:hypothetical protein
MNVTRPITITESMLISSSIAVDADSSLYGAAWKGLWVSGTPYGVGDVVYKGILLYESLVAANTGNDPVATSTGVSPKWLNLGKINRWRMFDEYTNTVSSDTDEIVLVLAVDEVDSVALFGLEANAAKVEILNNLDVSVWAYEIDLISAALSFDNWWDYYFAPYPPAKRDLVIPLGWMVSTIVGEKIRITLSGAGLVACGMGVVGSAVEFGNVQYEPEISGIGYGNELTDDFGRTYLKAGATARRLRGELIIRDRSESYVYNLLSDLLQVPAVWNLNAPGATRDLLITYGFLRDFREVIRFETKTTCSLEIQGLVAALNSVA